MREITQIEFGCLACGYLWREDVLFDHIVSDGYRKRHCPKCSACDSQWQVVTAASLLTIDEFAGLTEEQRKLIVSTICRAHQEGKIKGNLDELGTAAMLGAVLVVGSCSHPVGSDGKPLTLDSISGNKEAKP